MLKVFYTLIFSSLLLAQNNPGHIYFFGDTTLQNSTTKIYASPKYGWSDFCNKLQIIYNRSYSNMERSFDLRVFIDSSGNIKEIRNYGETDTSNFLNSIKKVIYFGNWKPAYSEGKNVDCELTIPILFYKRRFDNPFPLVIEGGESII